MWWCHAFNLGILMWQVTTMLWRRSWWHQQTPTSATPSLGRQCSQLLPTATLRQCCAWCSMEPPGATKLTVMSSRPSVASPPSSKHTCLPPITRVHVIYLPSPLVIAHDQLPCHCMLHCLVQVALPDAGQIPVSCLYTHVRDSSIAFAISERSMKVCLKNS